MAGDRARMVRRLLVLLLVAALAATCGATLPDRPSGGSISPGLVGSGRWPFPSRPLGAGEARGASYLPGSSVVLLGDGRVRLIPPGGRVPVTVSRSDPRVAEAVRGENDWLAEGRVPGLTAAHRDMARRALLDLRLLTRPNGASVASWQGAWRYVWPRDAAFAAGAFTVSGHPAEAARVLGFLARVQNDDGRWAARYHPDGRAVTDGRRPQLDSLGWVLWASWFFHEEQPDRAAQILELWPMVRRAADTLSRSLDDEGLPPPSSDYFERSPRTEQDPERPTLGVVGPVLLGLRSAAALARDSRHEAERRRWERAAGRLSSAVGRRFAPHGYPRSPVPGGRMDTSVTFLAPPFAPIDSGVDAAVGRAADKLRLANGGVLPGERWAGNKSVAWTPEMALFALAAASSGRDDEAAERLDWLAAHRTPLGVLPEKVDEWGRPATVAPLGWTASLVVMTLTARQRFLPIPPPGG